VPYTSSPTAEAGHCAADALYDAGEVSSDDRVLGSAEAEAGQPDRVRQAGQDVPHAAVDASRPHLDEHLVGADLGLCHVVQAQDVGRRAVLVADDRAHGRDRCCGGARALSRHDVPSEWWLTV
jgi:hypothetical protein